MDDTTDSREEIIPFQEWSECPAHTERQAFHPEVVKRVDNYDKNSVK
jgi:hypothetical protein